jgi:hypothetical protein
VVGVEQQQQVGATTMADKVFTNWDDTHSALWGHQPIKLARRLDRSALFSPKAA